MALDPNQPGDLTARIEPDRPRVSAAEIAPMAAAVGEPAADWANQLTNTIDQYVGLVRDRTTRPALVISRSIVFGVIIAILGVAAIVLLWIAWITGITALVKKVWITYLITGTLFVIAGIILMAKRSVPEPG